MDMFVIQNYFYGEKVTDIEVLNCMSKQKELVHIIKNKKNPFLRVYNEINTEWNFENDHRKKNLKKKSVGDDKIFGLKIYVDGEFWIGRFA